MQRLPIYDLTTCNCNVKNKSSFIKQQQKPKKRTEQRNNKKHTGTQNRRTVLQQLVKLIFAASMTSQKATYLPRTLIRDFNSRSLRCQQQPNEMKIHEDRLSPQICCSGFRPDFFAGLVISDFPYWKWRSASSLSAVPFARSLRSHSTQQGLVCTEAGLAQP